MQDVGGVHGFERPQGLVNEVLAVIVGEILGADDAVHVGFHQFLTSKLSDLVNVDPERNKYLDEIDLVEALIIARSLDIEDGNDVLVVEISQQLHLTQGSQAEHGVIKRGDLLDGHSLAGGFVDGGANNQHGMIQNRKSNLPDNAIGALADDIGNFILVGNVEGDLARAPLRRQLLHHFDYGCQCWTDASDTAG